MAKGFTTMRLGAEIKTFQATQKELAKMADMVMAPVPVNDKRRRPRTGTNIEDGGGNTAYVRWCTYGFLMALQWVKLPNTPPPSDEYIEALAGLYGLPIPNMAVDSGEVLTFGLEEND